MVLARRAVGVEREADGGDGKVELTWCSFKNAVLQSKRP
jgi:hypothetical protein